MPMNRVTLSGTMTGGEVVSMGFAFTAALDGGYVDTQDDLTLWASDIAGELLLLSSGSALVGVLSNDVVIDQVTTGYYPNTNGPVGLQGVATGDVMTGTGNASLPYPTCLVFTHNTGIPGPSRRGRTYWPLLNFAVENGKVDAGDLAALAGGFNDIISAIEDAAPGGLGVRFGVHSRKLALVTPVTSIRVGNVPDTQRRRRDALTEAFASVERT